MKELTQKDIDRLLDNVERQIFAVPIYENIQGVSPMSGPQHSIWIRIEKEQLRKRYEHEL